jgi:two-component system NarL family sensor kinase
MPETNKQVVVVIVAVILVLLFFGVMFLIMVSYYNNRKLLAVREKQMLKENFEKQLLQSRLEVQEHILNNISQEIHDNVGQILTLAKIQVNVMDHNGVFNRELVKEVKNCIGRALTDLRDIAKSLSGQRIQQLRISELIAAELQRIKKAGQTNACMDVTGMEKEPGFQDKLILFRMVQESLQNIIKHANASEIMVTLNYEREQLSIMIRDNGVGFDLQQKLEAGNGLGLQNIINRATLIRGRAFIKSVINEGTCIDIHIPYEYAEIK